MIHWSRGKRICAILMAAIMLFSSLCVSAFAATDDITLEEAKASLADVQITQTYNRHRNNDAVHNYHTDGDAVSITYSATLRMTDIMATYLQARQSQLYRASFRVHMNVDMDVLEFASQSRELTFTFTSTFLKPSDSPNYSYRLVKRDSDGVFTYEITVSKAWAERQAGEIVMPVELIVCYDGAAAYGFDEAIAHQLSDSPLMYRDFEVSDWMHEIKLTLADMRVRDSVARSVTYDSRTWRTAEAYGTVDGSFSYITVEVPGSIGDAARWAGDTAHPDYARTWNFGNDYDITEWESNLVRLTLKRETGKPTPTPIQPGDREPEDLNIRDHFAYVIGYPDGTVQPEGNITRAEVATIFFRMLKDESRNKYWSKTNPYTDVKSTDWYNNAISTLSNMGIINGYPDGTFRPNAGITRAEFAKIAVSFFKDNVRMTIGDAFSDIGGKWYTEYINLAVELAIVNGYPDGTFRPNNLITRAEAMTIVNNTLRRTPCKEGLLPVSEMITWVDNPSTAWYYVAVQEATNSHEYTRASMADREFWTERLPVRDWAAFEKAWSDANAAANPGEVVDGQPGLKP